MKIIIDARSRESSTGRYADRLLNSLQSLDDKNSYLVYLSNEDKWTPNNSNFSIKRIHYKQLTVNPLSHIGFAKEIKKQSADIVHFCMPQQPVFGLGEIKIVSTIHDLTYFKFPRKKNSPQIVFWAQNLFYKFLVINFSAKRSSSIIVPTKFVKEDLAKYQTFTKPKTHVTYEASEPPISAKAEKLKGADRPFIFHVGSPFPHKNIDTLIEAFSKLKANNPDLKLILPGKKEFYFNQLEANLNHHPLKKDILIPGFVGDAELKWLYQNAECYVLPSLSEGFGLPGLEAMAHSCPVVSSNATCLPEVYGDAAEYFDPEDVNDMAAKIEKVISSNEKRKELITKGKDQLKKYSWEKTAKQTLEIYKEVLEK